MSEAKTTQGKKYGDFKTTIKIFTQLIIDKASWDLLTVYLTAVYPAQCIRNASYLWSFSSLNPQLTGEHTLKNQNFKFHSKQ